MAEYMLCCIPWLTSPAPPSHAHQVRASSKEALTSGVRDCPKAWDWCAAAAIGTAAGAHFRRFDSELPFHFAASSGLCCAGSAPLADSLEAVLREVTGGAPLVEGAEESAATGLPGAPSKS